MLGRQTAICMKVAHKVLSTPHVLSSSTYPKFTTWFSTSVASPAQTEAGKYKTWNKATDKRHKLQSCGLGLVWLLLPVAQLGGGKTLAKVKYQVQAESRKQKPQIGGDLPTMRLRRKAFC